MNNKLIQLRHELHKHPELSNQEVQTIKMIEDFITPLSPDEVLQVGSNGRLFVFKGAKKGCTSVFRADLDAVPTQETGNLAHQSTNKGVMHACGHDGHMTILCGLAEQVSKNRPQKGTTVLLFQPAEECEQGAKDVLENENFLRYAPDFIFGLHNIPGEEKNTILIKEGSFAAASKGMSIYLSGKTSHAAEPEQGNSPADAIAKLITRFHAIRKNQQQFSALCLLTIVHIKMGEIAFGTNPGEAEMRWTLRAFEKKDMEKLSEMVEESLFKICKEEGISYRFDYCEEFPATVNHPEAIQLIQNAGNKGNCNIKSLASPFRWSEDFGYYTEKYKGGFFGLGAGKKQAALHHSDYDFPDEITETGVDLFYKIYRSLHL